MSIIDREQLRRGLSDARHALWFTQEEINARAPGLSLDLARREHYDGRAASATKIARAARQFDAVESGQNVVEYQKVEWLAALQPSERIVAARADEHMPSFCFEQFPDRL